jgi:hypothetical protein
MLKVITTKQNEGTFSTNLDKLLKEKLTKNVCDDFVLATNKNITSNATCKDDNILNKGLQTTITYILEYIRTITDEPELY